MRQFLIALIGLVVIYPFVGDLNHGDLIESALMMVLLVSAALAVSGRSRILTLVLVIPALIGSFLDQYRHDLVPGWCITAIQMVFAGFVIVQLIEYIVRETHVNAEVLCAGIAAYLMLAIFFTPAYLTISQLNPEAFSGSHLAAGHNLDRFDALYLSFVTLTCVGCNDITPLSKAARMLLMVESTAGVLCLAVLISRLVALYSNPGRKISGQQK
ncbi:MAG TPA: potassium channel family protein [Verrucomicrobiae bacterium]